MKLFGRHDLKRVGDDEPVFLIRASDAEGPNLLRKYAFLLRARHHGTEELASEIEAFAETMFEWQHAEGNAAPPPPPAPDDVEPSGDPGPARKPDPQPTKGKPK